MTSAMSRQANSSIEELLALSIVAEATKSKWKKQSARLRAGIVRAKLKKLNDETKQSGIKINN